MRQSFCTARRAATSGSSAARQAWCFGDRCEDHICWRSVGNWPTEDLCHIYDSYHEDSIMTAWFQAEIETRSRAELWNQVNSLDGCLECVRQCSCNAPSTPRNLRPHCYDSAQPGDGATFSRVAFYNHSKAIYEGGLLAGFSMCTLQAGMDTWEVEAWRIASAVLLCLPCAAFTLWLLLSVALARLWGHKDHCTTFSVERDEELVTAIGARAEVLRKRMRRRDVKPSLKETAMMYFDFCVFLADYLSDWNCLVQFLLSQQYGLAIAQGLIIACPFMLDLYMGRVQIVEVVGGLLASRRAGFPTNGYIKSLRSEKSVEAPPSLLLQFYTVPRITQPLAFWSALASMPLSILGISKFAYTTFELGLTDSAAACIGTGPAANSEATAGAPAHPVLAPGRFPRFPPGLPRPPATLQPQQATASLSRAASSTAFHAVVAPAQDSLFPIAIGNEKIADTE